jgi:hypoxanthine phosphoribosyltransferase
MASSNRNEALFEQQILTEGEVNQIISLMALELRAKYKDKDPLFVCLLKGGAPFAAKLMHAIATQDPYFHPELDYMIISTYEDERVGRQPRIVTDLAPHTKATGREIAILDDVYDHGDTSNFAKQHLLSIGASEVDIVTLALKDIEGRTFPEPDMYGFKSGDVWLTGMGMDDAHLANEANRWMGGIAISPKIED